MRNYYNQTTGGFRMKQNDGKCETCDVLVRFLTSILQAKRCCSVPEISGRKSSPNL